MAEVLHQGHRERLRARFLAEGLDAFATACNDIWMGGARGEKLSYARYPG